MLSKSTYSRRRRIAATILSAVAVAAPVLLPTGNAQAAPVKSAAASVRPAWPVKPASVRPAAQCWFGACFSYVTGTQTTSATTGASVDMYVGAPAGVGTDGHSLQELALQTTGGTTVANTIEVGWTVDPGVNGDYQPHLFVYHWINGQGTCYNGCGFVQVNQSIRAGMALNRNTPASFALINYSGNWWAYYNNVPFGYFPGSEWGGTFNTAQSVSAFGEVAASRQPTCAQMGNGAYGSAPGSSWISNYQLYGSPDRPYLSVFATDPGSYNYGSVRPTSFNLGGPGGC